jgi:starch synthase
MGAPRPGVFVAQPDPALKGANPALSTLSADLNMVNGAANATVVHSHTWYTGLAGHLAALLYGIPHVLTAHSLEPMRPWKAEQLGGGYRVSSWVEKTAVESADAVIAVSAGMRDDVLHTYPALDPNRVHVVRNGIDTDVWYPVDPEPATRCSKNSASTAVARSWPSSGGSPGRRGSRIWSRRPTTSRPRFSWCCAQAHRTPLRSRPR